MVSSKASHLQLKWGPQYHVIETPKIVLGQHLKVASFDFGLTIIPSMAKFCLLLTVIVSPLYIHHISYSGAPDEPMLQTVSTPSLDSLLHHSFPDTSSAAREGMILSIPVGLEVNASNPASSQ